MSAITYSETLKVAWLCAWRGVLISIATIGPVAFLVRILGTTNGLAAETIQEIGGFSGVAISLFFVYPLTIRMALRKNFKGFRLQMVRDSN